MKYEYLLSAALFLPPKKRKALRGAFYGAENLYREREERIRSTGILTEEEIYGWLDFRRRQDPDRLWDSLMRKGISFLPYFSEDFPRGISVISDAPYALYYKGSLPPDRGCIAIVGARNCSAYGMAMTKEIGEALSRAGFTIISGMARGVDGVAHRAALSVGGATTAVLGCGPDVIYPKSNRDIYEEIVKNGCILSEFLPETEPRPDFFPQRNRLISALSDIVVVTEAREKSGSLITAGFAADQGKDVYALPGRITDPLSKGCNKLIADGAAVITGTGEFLRQLSEFYPGELHLVSAQTSNFNLEKEELLVYSCLDFYAVGIDEIQRKTSLSLLDTVTALVSLSEKGLARECYINQYVKLR